MARRYFMFVMMTFGGSMVIATLLRLSETVVGDGTWAMTGCCDSVPDHPDVLCPDEDDPDDNACHVSLFRCNLALKNVFKEKSYFIFPRQRRSWKPTDRLSVKEFRDRLCVPNGVIVEFLMGRTWCLLRKQNNDMSSSPRNNSTRAPVASAGVVQGIPPFHQIPPVFHSPNIPVRAPAIPSIGDELPGLDEGGAKGHVMVRGPEKRGHLVDWVEKASFACLSKCFEIDAKERQCKMLLTARNLMAVVREPQEYVINILLRKMPNEVVPGEHYIVKDLPIYQASKEADAEKRRALLDNREKKKTKEPSGRLPDRNATQILLQRKLQRKRGSW
ncbi:hypothetical protein CK203_093526 [Vitis vinifera]|uniref:Uncharacterized protein n=1 Tax=Vitis vinifera TaxID=29760 RepID=A0A438D6G2_VITVI|nr:hypothetical protein CK203_093526 [Vitis vinifera]